MSSTQLKNVCGGLVDLELMHDYNTDLSSTIHQKIVSLRGTEGSWLVLGVGMHYQLDFEALEKRYLSKIVKLLHKSSWPRVIWLGLHGIFGFLRVTSGPANAKIEMYNQKVQDYLSTTNIHVIETFNMTKGVKSYDGRHYGIAVNLVKVQAVLNVIEQFHKG